MDLTEGIVARFRTMPISRASFLTGHALASVGQTMLALLLVVLVALLIGFRPTTGPVEWLAATGLLALIALSLTWVSLALGMVTKSVEAASNLPMPLMLLPFFGSGFVPTASMPDPLRWFADNQPFTPMMETLRRLLVGGDVGTTGLLAVGWCVAITILGYVWARRLFARDPSR
jgi:ABC-2 type transport system permease protein